MPYYQKLGQIPKKHHIWFHRNGAAPTYKNEGIAYEHVFTTQGFDEAYSIMYHLRPPTRVCPASSGVRCAPGRSAGDLRLAGGATEPDCGPVPVLSAVVLAVTAERRSMMDGAARPRHR